MTCYCGFSKMLSSIPPQQQGYCFSLYLWLQCLQTYFTQVVPWPKDLYKNKREPGRLGHNHGPSQGRTAHSSNHSQVTTEIPGCHVQSTYLHNLHYDMCLKQIKAFLNRDRERKGRERKPFCKSAKTAGFSVIKLGWKSGNLTHRNEPN